jgi:asparagine synthase (glutamine-hydrolysing)
MPLVSRNERLVLIIVGEHFPQLRKTISANGNGFLNWIGQDLLALYEESEGKLLASLNGWFCGLAADLKLRKVTLFNDRYGMGRVYFHEGMDEFIFASEAKSLLRIRPSLRAIEPRALAQYLRFDCVMGDMTLFKGISLLPAGSSWAFAASPKPQKKRYFDFGNWEQQPSLKAEEFYPKFDETVSTVFPAYIRGPAGVGLSLTAGLDTRAILACAREEKLSLPCYTFGGSWGETFDIGTARRLAAISKQPYEAIRINDHFLREFPSYAQQSIYISDGTHDAFGAHDVYFNEVAHNVAPIRLTGKFGSEVVGTRRLIPSGDFPRNFVQPWFVPFLEQALTFQRVSLTRHPVSRVVSEEIPWHEFGRVAVEQSKVVLRTPYMDNELVKLMYQAPPEARASRDAQERYVKGRDRELSRIPTNLGRMGRNGRLVSKIMYLPLWALFKVEYIYLFGTPHWLTWADRRLEKLRPEKVVAGRQKFEGYRIWLRTHFGEFVRETLLSPRARCTEFFERRSVARAVERHIAGSHNYLNEINKILTLELVYSSLLTP